MRVELRAEANSPARWAKYGRTKKSRPSVAGRSARQPVRFPFAGATGRRQQTPLGPAVGDESAAAPTSAARTCWRFENGYIRAGRYRHRQRTTRRRDCQRAHRVRRARVARALVHRVLHLCRRRERPARAAIRPRPREPGVTLTVRRHRRRRGRPSRAYGRRRCTRRNLQRMGQRVHRQRRRRASAHPRRLPGVRRGRGQRHLARGPRVVDRRGVGRLLHGGRR